MNSFPLVGVLDKTMTSEVQFDSLVDHAMGQPILVLAEIEKVPDSKRRQQFHHILDILTLFFLHSFYGCRPLQNCLRALTDSFPRSLKGAKHSFCPAWLPGFTPHLSVILDNWVRATLNFTLPLDSPQWRSLGGSNSSEDGGG